MVSAKQKAARAKFAAIMRSGGFKKRSKSRKTTRKVFKTQSVTHTMARRKRSIRRSVSSFTKRRGGARGILGSLKGTISPMAAGIGGGMIVEQVAQRVFPSATPIAKIGGAWLFGGVKGVIGSVAYDAITGQGGLLGGLFGGGASSSQGDSL